MCREAAASIRQAAASRPLRALAGMLALWLATTCGLEASPRFDRERAFRDLQAQVAIGPRPAGSRGSVETRALIRTRLEAAGWSVEEHPFLAQPPEGPAVPMANLVATLPGESDDLIVLAAHYDTKAIPGVRFVGANDGASGVALLLELARCLGGPRRPYTLRLAFFDGEEAFGPSITERDGLYGSRELALRMAQEGTLERIRALLLFDMVADRDLNLAVDLRSSPELRALLRAEAGSLVDPGHRLQLVDDHVPFLERGVNRVLALIDFQYGGRVSPGSRWHSARDDLDGVSAESLGQVGELAVRLLGRLEKAAEDGTEHPASRVQDAGTGGMLGGSNSGGVPSSDPDP